MILQGNEDLRVIKTIEGIKSSFETLICEKPYEKITLNAGWQTARNQMIDKVNDAGWSGYPNRRI